MGSYSSDDGKTQDLMKKAVEEISLTWAKRFKPQADATDLEQATVGPYVALQFEADVLAAERDQIPLAAMGLLGG